MDRMTSMTTFVKVVESEGFSAAARALGISPSMATTHVRALEERLGVRLLNRSTRRVSLTEAGQIYYDRCLQILAEVEDAERVAQALQSTPRGTLRLNTSVAIPPFLAPVIAEFVTLYPDVSINMTMTDRMIDLVEQVHAQLACRQDFDVSISKHATKKGLAHLHIVDLLQRRVDHILVKHPRDLNHAVGCDQISLVAPDRNVFHHSDQWNEYQS